MQHACSLPKSGQTGAKAASAPALRSDVGHPPESVPTATPLSQTLALSVETGGFASPPYDGYALA